MIAMALFAILYIAVLAIGNWKAYYNAVNDSYDVRYAPLTYLVICVASLALLVGVYYVFGAIVVFAAFLLCFVAFFFKNNVVHAVLIIIGSFSIPALVIYYGFVSTGTSLETSKVDPGYRIRSYEVTLDVGEDNMIDVTEEIETYFYASGKHGIYKFTPTWLEYTGKDGKTIKRKSNIYAYHAVGDEYVIDTVKKDKERIKIGNAYKTISGNKTYIIKYTYDMGEDPFDNFDEFIFHAFGEFWDTPIYNAKVTINMPKSIEGNTINVFRDKYRKTNVNEYFDIDVSDNTIVISTKDSQYVLDGALTVDIELPNNYFVGGSNNYGRVSYTISMISIALTGFVMLLWAIFGKDREKKVQTVEFYAPDNLNSAEIGYLFNRKRITRKLTISLLVQLASKGFIKIDEEKGSKKKDTTVTITILRKYYDKSTNELSECEYAVYKNLLQEGVVVVLNDHKNFYKAFDDVDNILRTKFSEKVYYSNTKVPKIITLCVAGIVAILGLISFYFVEDLNPKMYFLYYATFGCAAICLLFAVIMDRKTDYGEELSAKIKGFRDFLLTAEKDKLESLVESNPNYFYDILPYTYVLNVSKKWIEKFSKIAYNKIDIGDANYFDGDSLFDDIGSCITYPDLVTSSGGSSGGCSSCGGGCSSCGGGCSSCGGGGSW